VCPAGFVRTGVPAGLLVAVPEAVGRTVDPADGDGEGEGEGEEAGAADGASPAREPGAAARIAR
jgi:hypothetical protein